MEQYECPTLPPSLKAGKRAAAMYCIENNLAFTPRFVSYTKQRMLFHIGEEIRKERKLRKISQEKISADLGMSRSTISQLESGVIQDLGIRKVQRILEYLGLELHVRKMGAPPTLEDLQRENECWDPFPDSPTRKL